MKSLFEHQLVSDRICRSIRNQIDQVFTAQTPTEREALAGEVIAALSERQPIEAWQDVFADALSAAFFAGLSGAALVANCSSPRAPRRRRGDAQFQEWLERSSFQSSRDGAVRDVSAARAGEARCIVLQLRVLAVAKGSDERKKTQKDLRAARLKRSNKPLPESAIFDLAHFLASQWGSDRAAAAAIAWLVGGGESASALHRARASLLDGLGRFAEALAEAELAAAVASTEAGRMKAMLAKAEILQNSGRLLQAAPLLDVLSDGDWADVGGLHFWARYHRGIVAMRAGYFLKAEEMLVPIVELPGRTLLAKSMLASVRLQLVELALARGCDLCDSESLLAELDLVKSAYLARGGTLSSLKRVAHVDAVRARVLRLGGFELDARSAAMNASFLYGRFQLDRYLSGVIREFQLDSK